MAEITPQSFFCDYTEGYINVPDILQHRLFRGKYNLADIERVVETNNKQRFKLKLNQSTNTLQIKANQGHTIQIDDNELLEILEPSYRTVVHGTYFKCWQLIKIEGLSRMKRKHIHFAKGTLNDPNVISGIRKDVQVYIFIDLATALADGIKFYESENGVVLTQGNSEGYLEPKYFSRVIEVRTAMEAQQPNNNNSKKVHVTGYPPFTQPQDLARTFSPYGNVKVERINNKYAVLSFTTPDEAQEAINDSNKVNIYGEFLTVTKHTVKSEPSTPKREFARSKEKGRKIAEPGSLQLEGSFAEQLAGVLRAVRLAQPDVAALAALYHDLESALRTAWPGCGAIPFGSITTGLGIKTSDADCYISVPPNFRHPNANFVNKAKRILQQYPNIFAEIFAIPRANTPIVKFFHVPTETNCDVTFKSPLGAQNSKLIAFLLHADPRLIPMAVLVKYWAKVHGFSGTGKLTNYALTMLIIFYLQQPPVSILPSVEWLQRDREYDVIVDYWNTGFMHHLDRLPKSTNTSSISELLGGFFQYYSTFNFNDLIVCPYMGCPIKKDAFKNLNSLPQEFERYAQNIRDRTTSPMRFTTSMCVQDPFELCHNVASAVTSRLASEIIAFFKFAAAAYDKEKLNNCTGLLQTILLQKPKLPQGKAHPEFRAVIYPHVTQNIVNPDWKSVIREVTMKIFEDICKIKLIRVEEKEKEKENEIGKKLKEKYTGVVTKPIWKRKQFSKLYNMMKLDFLEKQTRITDEILNVEKQTLNVQFRLMLIFTRESRNAVALIKLTEGDTTLFKEFGKFFMTVMQNWFITLLRPHLMPRERKNPDTETNGVKNGVVKREDDEDLKIGVSQVDDDENAEDADSAEKATDSKTVNENVTDTNIADKNVTKTLDKNASEANATDKYVTVTNTVDNRDVDTNTVEKKVSDTEAFVENVLDPSAVDKNISDTNTVDGNVTCTHAANKTESDAS